ncbi:MULTISPECIES: matrixin family metalloprotease [Acinetobacter]|uniref:matrixin family metalloprotease n=1 Tax=Acinetobacter TaxID=469 RepID=UPI000EA27C16|nr:MULTISPECIES: matrixin family metalloprotease [Acinetobacter]RKG41545.1 hypothetical protein D7V51_13585 [Acinetobacter cumulans]RZG57273.1 matrixin family metalloprotease [Acinetobacter sp. WCHAc060006]
MRFFILTIVLLFVGLLSYQLKTHDQLRYNSLSDRILHPFDTRLRYQIAEVDPRFGISQQELIELTQQAADLWQNASGQKLFVYDPDAQLKIHLVYDERQDNFNAFKKMETTLNTEQNKNQRVSENLNTSQAYLEQLHTSIQQRRVLIDAEYQSLNQQRLSWSRLEDSQGENRRRIDLQYQQLKEKSQQLKNDIDYFNQLNAQYNQQVDQYNHNIHRFNQNVTHAKQQFPAREFHKGVFMGQEIQIYQFENQDDLRLTLAHELGHALGLGHNSDPKALMYPMLGAQDLAHFQLQPSDLALLTAR